MLDKLQSITSELHVTDINLNLLTNPSLITEEENAFHSLLLEQAMRGLSMEQYVHSFIDDGIGLVLHLDKESTKQGLERTFELHCKFTLRLKGSMSPSDYLPELQTLRSQLQSLDQVIPDNEFFFVILKV